MAEKTEGRKPRRGAAPAVPKTVKRTLLLSPSVDEKLDVFARRHGQTRSEAADRVLAAALSHVVISFRSTEAVEGSGETPLRLTGTD